MPHNKLPMFDDLDNQMDDELSSLDELLNEYLDEEGDSERIADTTHQPIQVKANNVHNEDLGEPQPEKLAEPDFDSDFESFKKSDSDNELNEDFESENLEPTKENQMLDDDTTVSIRNSGDVEEDVETNISLNEEPQDNFEEEPYSPNPSEEEYGSALLPGMDLEVEDVSGVDNTETKEGLETKEGPAQMDADAKAKETFELLKNKVMGLLKSKGKPKLKRKKDKFSPRKKNPKGRKRKFKPLMEIKKYLSNLGRTKKILLISTLVLIVSMITLLQLSLKSYSAINDLETKGEFEDKEYNEYVDITLNNFNVDGNNVSTSIANEGDMSSTFSLLVTFKQKKLIPFSGKRITCQSDIVYLETNSQIEETLPCDSQLDKEEEYKINVEVDKF